MNGDTVSLPIYGTVRKHEWQPCLDSRSTEAKPRHRLVTPQDNSIGAEILKLLEKSKDGMTMKELHCVFGGAKGTISSRLTILLERSEIYILGVRGKKNGRVYRKTVK